MFVVQVHKAFLLSNPLPINSVVLMFAFPVYKAFFSLSNPLPMNSVVLIFAFPVYNFFFSFFLESSSTESLYGLDVFL